MINYIKYLYEHTTCWLRINYQRYINYRTFSIVYVYWLFTYGLLSYSEYKEQQKWVQAAKNLKHKIVSTNSIWSDYPRNVKSSYIEFNGVEHNSITEKTYSMITVKTK